MRHSLPYLRAVFNKPYARTAFAALVVFGSIVSANATTNSETAMIGVSGTATGSSFDGCISTDVYLQVSALGSRNLNQNASNVASVTIIRFDSCQSVTLVAFGDAQDINLSGVKASQLPTSIAASGRIPLSGSVYDAMGNATPYSDALTFQLALKLIGPHTDISQSTRSSILSAASPSTTLVTIDRRIDGTKGDAAVTSSLLFTSTFSIPPLSVGFMSNDKSRSSVRITH
ncbi:hypothetical protein AWB81_04205 [Caballeronia arationis]|uniref:hypothetical protein n=1 Tax=Caballeronia arationis TaxID=1777142 RepID=UPI00074BFC2F|nr:hypothetical protein [Caballeronia arationis]SAK83400.1 hypothetical protein AWB81_04205 [Caballeronia arationis]